MPVPVLVLLTLPVTLVTLGRLLPGLSVNGFGAALIGSLIYSLCGMVIDVAMERVFPATA